MFDKHLAILAANEGARIVVNARLKGIKRKGEDVVVGTTNGNFKTRLVVAADGVESRTAKFFGINTTLPPKEVDSCFQYEMVGINLEDERMLEFYLGKEVAPRGYVWIFPKGRGRANVGVGIAGDLEKSAKYYLEKFVSSRKDLSEASIVQAVAGVVPVSAPLKQLCADNLLKIGRAHV